MNHRHLLFAVLLALVAACAPAEKYPYPPQFVSTEEVVPTALPAPPAKDSAMYKKAMNTVLARQRHLSPQKVTVLKAEDHISPTMLTLPVLGKAITPENFPKLYNHLRHAGSDAWRITDATQDYWQSPRPWYADGRVNIHVDRITRPGYPSGHTTTTTVWAYVLGDLLPCKQSALLARASAIGYHRVDAGAHFPFDVEAGKTLAKTIYGKMTLSPEYQQEHTEVRKELGVSSIAGVSCISH